MDRDTQTDEMFFNDYFIFSKNLGWKEIDEYQDEVDVMIIVVDANLGFNIFRLGEYCELLDWMIDREEALEYAVDSCRKEIAFHEISEMGKD
jgi:hypothetical protein